MYFLYSVVCAVLVMLAIIGYAHATENHIGIIISNTCITQIKNNVSHNCPTYEDVVTLFPDTSDKFVSGGFVNENGYYHREPSRATNHFKFYELQPDRGVVWVDPPGDIIERIPRIVLTAGSFEYTVQGQVLTNSSYVVGYDRYVSSTCTYAIINGDQWLFLLGDTIQYMQNGCHSDYTNFKEKKTIQWEAVEHDITTSAKYKLEQWQKQSIERCGFKICKNEEAKFNPERAG